MGPPILNIGGVMFMRSTVLMCWKESGQSCNHVYEREGNIREIKRSIEGLKKKNQRNIEIEKEHSGFTL